MTKASLFEFGNKDISAGLHSNDWGEKALCVPTSHDGCRVHIGEKQEILRDVC
jgi:hypothetical protein